MGDARLFQPGLPIDVNRLFWFISDRRGREKADTLAVELGYDCALDDLEEFLRGGGYEAPRT